MRDIAEALVVATFMICCTFFLNTCIGSLTRDTREMTIRQCIEKGHAPTECARLAQEGTK